MRSAGGKEQSVGRTNRSNAAGEGPSHCPHGPSENTAGHASEGDNTPSDPARCFVHHQLNKPCSPVHHFSSLGPCLIDTDQCRPRTPQKSCSFGDALTLLSSHHNLALFQNTLKLLCLLIFPASNTSTLRTTC